jgi:hypothetical protein
MTKPYPEWVCNPCGRKYGNFPLALCTWHQDICGVCGKLGAVCTPRDFGHLRDGWQDEQTPPALEVMDRGVTVGRTQRGFLTLGSAPWLIAAVCAVSAVMFLNLYRSTTHEFAKFRTDVEAQMESVRVENEQKLAAMEQVARTAESGWMSARTALANRPVRVRDNCGTGGLSPLPTSAQGLDATASLGTIDSGQCETYLNAGIEDAAKLMHLQQWITDTHEASK